MTMLSQNDTGGDAPMWQFVVFQLVDSCLPAGGFAHSQGVEAAMQAGALPCAAAFDVYARVAMDNASGLLLPFLTAAHAHCTSAGECAALSAALQPMMAACHVASKASLTQGAALLRTALAAFPEECAPLAALLDQCSSAPPPPGTTVRAGMHVAPLFGAVCGLLNVPPPLCRRMFMYILLRDMVSAATRLNLLGPMQATGIQARLASSAEAAVKVAEVRMKEAAGAQPAPAWMRLQSGSDAVAMAMRVARTSAPLQDTFQGGAEHLFTRLFCS
mmetsp:Transcript_28813/g.48385  ORF Transcript_28813/g.48385 Transcript_28813/m.48385 type:complete len:274 (+) Transcript_28813:206-1027(+)